MQFNFGLLVICTSQTSHFSYYVLQLAIHVESDVWSGFFGSDIYHQFSPLVCSISFGFVQVYIRSFRSYFHDYESDFADINDFFLLNCYYGYAAISIVFVLVFNKLSGYR